MNNNEIKEVMIEIENSDSSNEDLTMKETDLNFSEISDK